MFPAFDNDKYRDYLAAETKILNPSIIAFSM